LKLATRKLLDKILITIFLLLLYSFAGAYTSISVETGGGYSGNLYADSFSIGDSYLLGGLSIANTSLKTTKFRIYYSLDYYEYDTRNSINQFDHLAGISLFRKKIGDKLNWGIDIAGAYRDYTDENSEYDNNQLYVRGNFAYYLVPGLQVKSLYQFESSSYSGFDNLNNNQHRFDAEVIKTFPSRTTARIKTQYFYRQFTIDNSAVDWLDLEFKLSQSLDLRTGASGSATVRFAGDGTRPLSSYFYISGVTPYWDPWDGYQLNLSLKRIFRWGILGTFDFDYWDRTFHYSESQQNELPWLAGKSSRHDRGWVLRADINRQFNLYGKIGRDIRIRILPGYLSNDSDDSYYDFKYFYINAIAEINIF
jgi:hypothetical protein